MESGKRVYGAGRRERDTRGTVYQIGYGRADLSIDTHTPGSAVVLLPLVVADWGHVEGGHLGGTGDGLVAWAVRVQSRLVGSQHPWGT